MSSPELSEVTTNRKKKSACPPKCHGSLISLLMGIWFVSSFVANLAGGLIASRVEAIERGEITLPWHFGGQADFFFLFVVTSLSSGLLILALTPWLKPLTAGRDE